MKKFLHILLPVLLLAAGCRKEETPSYVGRWEYLDSQPDLGPAYSQSWFTVSKYMDYSFYDVQSGKTVEGTREDFLHEGLTITLVPAEEYGFPPLTFKLTRLKDNLMEIETTDIGEGNPTTIRFSRVSEY